MLGAQVSFNPAKEQLDGPSCLVKHADGQGGYFLVVGQKDECTAGFRIVVTDPAQPNRICLSGYGQCGFSNMIAAQAGGTIHGFRVLPGELEVILRTSHDDGARFSVWAWALVLVSALAWS
jgi:hypothetical protein